jgi:hypothetical protein
MTTSTEPKNIRLTITVTPEVHETFTRFAKAASMPVGRAMGEWHGDTLDAATWTAKKMEDARAQPKIVAREMHAYALGMVDEAQSFIDSMKGKGVADRAVADAAASAAARSDLTPPPSNTGGKVPRRNPNPRTSKS